MKLKDHPAVQRFYKTAEAQSVEARTLDASWLRQLCLDCGADDVGLVEIERPALDDQRDEALQCFRHTKMLISFVCRMNREPIRAVARSVANLEFKHSVDDTNEIARRIVGRLEREGIRAVNPGVGYPMEMDKFPGKVWVVSHKPVAEAAGLGRMGLHRNVIHPKFGNFVLLGTILIDARATAYDQPIEYNPCLECKLCVAACPVGAISPEGRFNFSACYTHNYREFTGGFIDWVDQLTNSSDAADYRKRVSDPETASMWQSLAYGSSYKAAYCMAVCPAGDDVIGPYLADPPGFIQDVMRPLVKKEETVFVLKGSDAETHVARRFPHKTTKQVNSGIRTRSIADLTRGLDAVFQPGQAAGVDHVYHFTFKGKESALLTVIISDQKLQVLSGHHGQPDLQVIADSQTWLGIMAKEKSLLWALLTRKLRLRGSPRLLLVFKKCFAR